MRPVDEAQVPGDQGHPADASNGPIRLPGSLLVRNVAINMLGQVIPLVVALIAIPFIIEGMGKDRFGVFSIARVVLAYFGVFHQGIGRAATRSVAVALGKGDSGSLPGIIWTALVVHVVIGVLGGLLLAAATPLLVVRIFNFPEQLLDEVWPTFYLMALGVPVVVTAACLRGILQAAQRFDLVNYIKAPSACLTYILPVLVLHLGRGLPAVTGALVAVWSCSGVCYFVLCLAVFPSLSRGPRFDLGQLRPLLSFGGWVAVTSVAGALLRRLSLLLCASLLTMEAVAFYSAPYEMSSRILVLPGSLVLILFPAFSSLHARKDYKTLSHHYTRSVKYMLAVMVPVVAAAVLLSEDLLRFWLGNEFAVKSTTTLQLLAVGALLNSLAQIPFVLLQGSGHPAVVAAIHLFELPLHAGVSWLLVSRMGVPGAALAWVLRGALDTVLLYAAAHFVGRPRSRESGPCSPDPVSLTGDGKGHET